ncbi:hypothetical protein JGH11_11055 [Dysgonomonas sp. Marseille-P4677]|uniref:hypothetical protein n=1 Tax=Dysgonomonas sp. Marseille-P4677 TaxID=2364790 RepID=UPI00191161ED|nr:hypothetical protein [Dysgonomonas sp. Marseille-P4677]MBK5721412.1 hypothetical protein [Dysgonomonas sp. Marseille-P4677]
MRSEIYKIKDIVGTFKSVKEKGKKFRLANIDRAPGSGLSLDLVHHQQGLCRVNNYFFISGSVTGSELPYIYGINAAGGNFTIYINANEYRHAGGLQVAENILAVGIEEYDKTGLSVYTDRSRIYFYDLERNHLLPGYIQRKDLGSAVGIIRRNGQWILAVRGKGSTEFYVSDDITQTGTISSDGLPTTCGFRKISKIATRDYQSISLFLDEKNELYMVGMPDGSSNHDKCWMFHLSVTLTTEDKVNTINTAQEVAYKHFKRDGDGPRFKWAAGAYFDAKSINDNIANGDFIIYSAEAHVINREIRCNRFDRT